MTGSLILGQKFDSIKEVLEAIEKYGKEQGVPYTIFNCRKADTHNRESDPDKRMPLEQRYKEIIVACKHYGKPRQSKHKEGTKQRGNQRTFKKYCKAKVNFNYSLVSKCHIVTKIEETHSNHSDDKRLFKLYPENRRANKETVAKVNVLFENEAKTHRIRDVLLNSGVMASGQDIQNLRNKWLASCKGEKMSVEESLFNQLQKLKDEDPNSVVVVHYDEESNVIQSIFFQTSYMRESLEEFPELLIMDTTYKLCNNEMPLIVFSVVDCFGVGRIGGYAVIFSETKQIVTAALGALRLGHEKLVENVKVVYVDKAQSEIAAIKQVLPNAEVHLCDFHVKDTFKRLSVKNLVKDKRKWDAIEKQVMAMIHSHTKEQYDKAYEDLTKAAAGEPDFMNYFTKNWHKSQLVWCDYQRNESFTLGERTTGRVESHNAKVKIMVDKKYPVPEVILRLCVLNRNSSIENSQRVFNQISTTKYHKYSRDPVIQQILTINTPFVGKFLQAQYERSLEPPSESIHEVTLETCDCKFFNQSRLICSHIFRKRRLSGVEVYDHKLVPKRWTVIVPSDDALKNFSKFEILTSPIKSSKIKKTMTEEERYNLADSIGKRISSYVANFGGDEFHHRINALMDFEELVRMGKRVAVVGINGEGQPVNQEKISSNESILENNLESNQSQSICDDLGNKIYVSAVKGQGNYSSLTSAVKKNLKLPLKCPVPGRPKGKRVAKSKNQTQKTIAEEDPDDVMPVNEDQCEVCNGPVTRLTSCSKGNQGRKYITCQDKKLPACKDFHKWLSIKGLKENSDKQQDCVVCANSGPPSMNGAHKCNSCGNPVHAIDGLPCCSIATDPEEEGYGSRGRTCLKCVAANNKNRKALTSSISQILNRIDLPTVALDSVAEYIDKTVPVDIIDNSASLLNLDTVNSTQISCSTVVKSVKRPLPTKSGPHKSDLLADDDVEDKDKDSGHDTSYKKVNEKDENISNGISDSEGFETDDSMFSDKCVAPSKQVETDPIFFPKKLPVKGCFANSQRVSEESESEGTDDGVVDAANSSHISDVTTQDLPPVVSAVRIPPPTPEKEKICFGCKEPAVLLTARTPKNYGRRFYACRTQQLPKCKWMNWLDKATPRKGSMNQSILSFHQPTLLDDDGLDNVLSRVGEEIDPSCVNGIGLGSNNDLPLTETPALVDEVSVNAKTQHFPLDRRNVTIRRKRALSSSSSVEDVKPKLMKTSHTIEVVTIDSDSESDDKLVSHTIPAVEDCVVCQQFGPPKDSGHKCAQCSKLVHAFGCSAPNHGGVEGFGGSDRLCWPCFHKVTNQGTKPVAEDPVPQLNNDSFCAVCNKPYVASCQCACCMQYVHAEECSIKNPSSSDGRICTNCFCLLCKGSFNTDHVCMCHICDAPALSEDGVICYRCERICHPNTCTKKIRAKEKLNGLRFICQHCLCALTVAVSPSVMAQINNKEMLSDEHIVRASVMLAAQFQGQFDGLCTPMGVLYGNQVDKPDYYPKRTSNDIPWVQILNTGQQHWVTAIFPKGSSVKIMDSLRNKPMTSHTKIQVAMILFSKERIEIGRPPCKQQENGIDCGLFAIANATEFCFSSVIQYVDFDQQQLRSHWLKCLENGILSRFPRFSKRPKKVKEQEDFELVYTYCFCRLPGSYDNLIACEKCSKWFHHKCVGLFGDWDDAQDWFCSKCVANT